MHEPIVFCSTRRTESSHSLSHLLMNLLSVTVIELVNDVLMSILSIMFTIADVGYAHLAGLSAGRPSCEPRW